MHECSDGAVCYSYQLWITHQLERMGEWVTNIAEKVVFLASAKLVNFVKTQLSIDLRIKKKAKFYSQTL